MYSVLGSEAREESTEEHNRGKTMTDDKPVLTRRRILGGMATIGVAGALGAGTWAQMHDTEQAAVAATAGTLNLRANGGNATIPVKFKNLKNGDSKTETVTLTNTGSIPGESLCFYIPKSSIEERENSYMEAEREAGESGLTGPNDGELREYTSLEISVGGQNVFGPALLRPDNIVGQEDRVCINLDPALADQELPLEITLHVNDDDVSTAMSDSFSFDLNFTLYDNEQSSS
jgi:predicted ribosomally synthesized peptide with SipW-like signal peptide